jgi:anti-sigma-K factor RskA
MMMRELDRGEIQDRLPDYVHGTLSDDARQAVEAAVASDPGLARDLVLVRVAREALTPRAVPVDADKVVAAIRRPGRARGMINVGRWRIAAVIATLAIGGASLAVVQKTFHGYGPDSLMVANGSAHGAASEPLAITFGYGLSELAIDDLEKVMAELEKAEALPAVEPQARRVIVPTVEESR